jgi:hypothetical protein
MERCGQGIRARPGGSGQSLSERQDRAGDAPAPGLRPGIGDGRGCPRPRSGRDHVGRAAAGCGRGHCGLGLGRSLSPRHDPWGRAVTQDARRPSWPASPPMPACPPLLGGSQRAGSAVPPVGTPTLQNLPYGTSPCGGLATAAPGFQAYSCVLPYLCSLGILHLCSCVTLTRSPLSRQAICLLVPPSLMVVPENQKHRTNPLVMITACQGTARPRPIAK